MKNNNLNSEEIHNEKKSNSQNLSNKFKFPKIRKVPTIVSLSAFLVSLLVVMYHIHADRSYIGDIQDFEVGKVAERDVIAEQAVSYIDEEETDLRISLLLDRTPVVFIYFQDISDEIKNAYDQFVEFSVNLFNERLPLEIYKLRISTKYRDTFSPEALEILFNHNDKNYMFQIGKGILDYFIEHGIFSVPENVLENYRADTLELLRDSNGQVIHEKINQNLIVTLDNLNDTIAKYMADNLPHSQFRLIAFDILSPFIKENAFFSLEDTEKRMEEARRLVEPVVKFITPGERIIRKGFIVTKENMAQLSALNTPIRENPRVIMGQILLFLLVYAFFVFLTSVRLIGRKLKDSEIYLLSILTALYMIGASFAEKLPFNTAFFPVSIVLPTALVIMLSSILIGAPLALAWAVVLPLGAFLANSFDLYAYIFAVASGVAASYSLKGAEKRMDLVKAGIIIAVSHGVVISAISLINSASLTDYLIILFWSAFNGIASGMLVLGILPLLEQALNSATSFRLIELSDLNAPLLRRLFTTASGTYSHSIMVANLAEAACKEIGANALLARVGAYYHDIGKMEDPDYFVENQTSHNKHDELPPSLSATIIRSHVRIGVEKARAMKLPQEVINIVSEHHGNSIITWFYNKALEQDPHVDPMDYSYPGTSPRSKESAVVMLADMCEAAVRTLENPTAERIEAFIQELISAKVKHGQLAECELTFRDLETIKRTFVQVLAGYYHARIKYPKLPPLKIEEKPVS